MRKVINKGEREHILLNMVADSCKATAVKAVGNLKKIRAELHALMLKNWSGHMPGVSRDDQLTLLQSHCANSLSFNDLRYRYVVNDKVSEQYFSKLWWSNDGVPDAKRIRFSRFTSMISSRVPGFSETVDDGVSNSWSSYLNLRKSFPDLIAGFVPLAVYGPGVEIPKDADLKLNKALRSLHDRAMVELQALKDLLESAEDMYHNLGAAIAPLKSAMALAELMPEAVKHFPPSLTYVKPTKELADPNVINDIRKKLKAGLPV